MKTANPIDADPDTHVASHTESRLTELEIKASFIEDTLDQLNDIIVRQQQQIDRLLAEAAAQREQRETSGADALAVRSPGDERPPHY